jgi:hypothetical protein
MIKHAPVALRCLAFAAFVTAAGAAAGLAPARPLQPDDFAWQWPLDVRGAEGVARVALTPEIYARLTRADLSDLAAFNAAGEPIPFGPAAQAFERLQPPPPAEWLEVPLFRVPRTAAASGDRVELHIARGSDGRLSQLDAAIEPGAAQAAQDVLLDVSVLNAPVTALQLELDALPDAGLDARLEVAASDDLAGWQTLATGLAVVSLREAGMTLERTRLELPATTLPYLRLRRLDREATLPLRAVRALPQRSSLALLPPHQSFVLQGRPLPETPGSFEYRSAGPFPVERIAIALADANSVSGYVLESRAGDGPWIERARGTAFRLGSNGEGVMPAPLDLPQIRDAQWRLRTEPAQPRAPQLTLSWRPEQFVLLTQGAAPYRLAAGSRVARRPEYPLRSVLAEMRARHGDLWLPAEAAVGAGAPLAGDAALSAPPPPPPYKQWLLWGVLLGGAALVIGMVLKLMRAPPAPP